MRINKSQFSRLNRQYLEAYVQRLAERMWLTHGDDYRNVPLAKFEETVGMAVLQAKRYSLTGYSDVSLFVELVHAHGGGLGTHALSQQTVSILEDKRFSSTEKIQLMIEEMAFGS